MPFQYIGALGYYRDSSGRTYVRARVLRTDLGSWMTVDPLWPEDLAFTYGWASPVTFTDHSGTQPRPKASGIPKPLMQCLTKKAQQILLDKLGSKKCSEAIKKECGKSGTDALNDKGTVPKYLFEKDCSPGMQGEGGTCRITLPTNPPPPYPKGSKCEVLAICLAIDLCTGRGTFAGLKNLDLVQACTVIWELGNACSCKKNGYDPQENGAARVAAACGCGGVVGPGGAAIR